MNFPHPPGSVSETFQCEGCQRTFTEHGPLSNHRRGCKSIKKRLNSALGKAREIIGSRRKRQRVEEERVDLEEQPPVQQQGQVTACSMTVDASQEVHIDALHAADAEILDLPLIVANVDSLATSSTVSWAVIP